MASHDDAITPSDYGVKRGARYFIILAPGALTAHTGGRPVAAGIRV
jgi:hypothetical protein